MSTTGAIEIIKRGDNVVLPVTSSHAVLINETVTDTIPGNTLAAKLGEIDNSISDIKTVTDNIWKNGDGSIKYTEDGLVHAKTTNIPKGLNPTVNEAIYKFKIDNNGHITDIKEAGLEDFGIGMPIKYCGEYPTNNTFTPSVGEMYLVNTGFISKYNKGDVNDFAIYDGETFNIILSDIDPNVNLNNGSSILYGTAPATIYAPKTLGTAGLVLVTNSAEDGLEWKPIYAPTELGNKGMILGTDGKKLTWMDYPNLTLPSLYAGKNAKGTFITYNRSNVYLQGDDYISVNWGDTSKIQFSLNSDKLKTSGISFNVSSSDKATLSSGGLSVILTGDNVSFFNDNGNLKLTASKPEAGIGLTYLGNTLQANLELTLGITSNTNSLVTVTTQLGTPSGGKETNVFGSTTFTIKGDDNIKISKSGTYTNPNIELSAIPLANLITSINGNITKLNENLKGEAHDRTALDNLLSNRIGNLERSNGNINSNITQLRDSVTSMSASYSYITEEIWGKNHNYDWAQASRIDKLGNAFNWGLRFSDGIILAPHNNGIIVPYGTTEKIHLPKCGVCWVGYTLFSKAPITITVGGISVSLNEELYVVNKDDDDNKFYMRRVAGLKTILSEPYLTIQSSQGTTSGTDKTAYLTDIVIYFEDGSPTKLMQLQESINKNTESYEYVNSWDLDGNNSNIFYELFENLSQGFYQLTYSVLGKFVTPSITTDGEKYCVIASLLYPINTMTEGIFNIRNNGSFFTNRNFYTNDCKVHHDIITTTNSDNINEFNYTTFLTIYYVPESGKTTLYLRTWNKGAFTVKNVSLKPISWSDTINNYVINSPTINNPLLSLTSQNSKLYNRVVEFLSKLYIQLVYEVDNKIIWTLDWNGLTMGSSDIPMVTIKEKYYFVRNNPYEINNFSLTSSCQKLVVKIEDDQIIHESGVEGSKGYYISSIAQMNSDGSATHTLLYYQPDAVIYKIRRTIIILKDGKIQDGILI